MRRPATTLLTIGLVSSLLVVPGRPAVARSTAGPRVAGELGGTVTLITGDKVDVIPGAPPKVTPAPERAAMRFRITTEAGRVRVIPLDAVSLLAAGKLDPRLFDVTELIRSGYDDTRRPQLPLIVQRTAAARSAAVTLAGGSGRRELPSIGAFSVQESKRDAVTFWKSLSGAGTLRAEVGKVWLNGLRHPTLDKSVPQIGAPAAWSAGLTGRGVTVAVVDTGIDAQHPDLIGKVAAAKNFVDAPAGDQVGHGTHVASTITGTGAASGGGYRGVAPDARLLDAKVCLEQDCPEDAILAGMEWAAVEQQAAVVNLSLGSADAPGDDPLEQAVNALSAQHGTLFVVAAGNSGHQGGGGTIDSPGSAASALTVGAVDKQDVLADFSGRGATSDGLVKPDVTAPGVDIVAAKAAGTEAGTPVGDHYVSLSGTSMATPHVAGAAAILLQQHPDWTGAQVKAVLTGSAKPAGGSGAFDQGAGRIDVARAIKQQVTATPASLSFGLARWPHEDDPVQTKTIAYRNSADTPVTLDLELRIAGNPAGLFTVSPQRLVVPAGGTAEATVTADTRSGTVPAGRFSGQLVASTDGTTVSVPVGVEKETEMYPVEVTTIGRDGKAPREHLTFFDRIGDCGTDLYCGGYLYGAGTPTATLRLPPGDYTVADFSTVTGNDWTLLMHSVLTIGTESALTLDARKAKPLAMSVPKATARLMEQNLVVARDVHRGPGSALTYFQPGDAEHPIYVTDLGPPAPSTDVVSIAYARFAEPGPAGDFANSPYEYNVAAYRLGQVLDGVQLNPRQQDFATVNGAYAVDTDVPDEGKTMHWPHPADATLDYAVPTTDARELVSTLPFRRTEYYLTHGLAWSSTFVARAADGSSAGPWLFDSERSVYRPGRTYQQQWNKGVFGPRLISPPIMPNGLARGARRVGDQLILGLSLRSDSNPLHVNEPKLPSGSAKLYRDGELVVDWPRAAYVAADVPPAGASYRLETRVETPWSQRSTTVETAWTFRSAHVDGSAALPFMAVNFTPPLDDHNQAQAGSRFVVPVSVQRQPGAPAVRVKNLTVDVSTDDGKTWRAATVHQVGDGWRAEVDNPRGAAVSLRSVAEDVEGNKVEQTVLRGYVVKR
ncbi:S8 family serine peptidase [Kribbella qitaiheensis]|uniref:S8 family serine peptidase n=1 Tax=Kribbella qitaiheensis TaxID=1544730 RepID=A0A7G6WY86_9ACTN|nr:S8 family serine peptidase [Kribbella qitaiheensis]QNE18951.1 S8 family serine peptidase [Kribbella qitaiheensis]